jgi:hypothetical protein
LQKKPARPALTAWEHGLALAKEAQEMFSKGVSTGSIEALEGTATSALKILTQRQVVRCPCECPDFNNPLVSVAFLDPLTIQALQ